MKFGDYAPDDAFIDPHTKDEVYVFHFENGYGANIARGPYTYGGPQGLWELAVTKKSRDGWGYDLCYDTPITNDVIGWLDELGVVKVLKKSKIYRKFAIRQNKGMEYSQRYFIERTIKTSYRGRQI